MILDRRAVEAVRVFADAPCGDVYAARDCALALLAESHLTSEGLMKARLLISAVLVHLQARAGADPTPADLHGLLLDLHQGVAHREGFAQSPVGFVRYVAAELIEGQLDDVLSSMTRIVAAARRQRCETPTDRAAITLSAAAAHHAQACENPVGVNP